jgi:hypothetical protein
MLSCGPTLLGMLMDPPGVVSDLLLALHPVVATEGPQLFEELPQAVTMRLENEYAFSGGVVLLRYTVGAKPSTVAAR